MCLVLRFNLIDWLDMQRKKCPYKYKNAADLADQSIRYISPSCFG